MQEQGVGAQQEFGDNQHHDIPLDPQAASGLQQAEQSFHGARDDVEFAIECTIAFAQLVFLRQSHVEALEVGVLP